MRPVAPRIVGVDEIQYDGEHYKSITIGVHEYESGRPARITRWTFTPEERAAIASGADIFVSMAGTSIPPMHLDAGWPYGPLEK